MNRNLVICILALLAMVVWSAVGVIGKPMVTKLEYVTGEVASPPLVGTSSGKIAYAVYVKEFNGTVCLSASQCPLLKMGDRVVITQANGLSKWYVYVRPAK